MAHPSRDRTASSRQRLELIKTVIEAEHTHLSTRIAAPIPEPLLPFFHQHLADRGNHQTMNHRTRWLFPGTRAGHHIA